MKELARAFVVLLILLVCIIALIDSNIRAIEGRLDKLERATEAPGSPPDEVGR